MNKKSKLNPSVTKALSIIFTGLLLAGTQAWADVSGTVYRDLPVNGSTLNTYGVQDANELGVAGITVTVTDSSGAVMGTPATTDANGNWTVAGTSGDVRVEFSNIPSYLESSPVNTGSNTTVQFIADGSTADLGLHYPADYSDSVTPLVAIPRHENGLAAGNNSPAIYSLAYDQNGNFGPDDNVPDDWSGNADATFAEIGATWGMAYQRSKQRMFVSALIKRHSGLANGLDAIYVLDYSSVPVSSISHFNLQGTSGIDLGSLDRSSGADYTLATPVSASVDLDAFNKTGKAGIGGLELSEDEKTLWAVNLNEKALIQIDVSGASVPGAISQTQLSGLPGLPTCTGGELRPWGIKFYQGKGYLGFVCDAETSQNHTDLAVYVHSFSPDNLAAGLTQELTFDLDYIRTVESWAAETPFQPWISTWDESKLFGGSYFQYAQAILSDIEFSPDGSMYLAFLDRWGNQGGHFNRKALSGNTDLIRTRARGELLKVCNVSGTWVIEGSSVDCPVVNEVGNATGVSGNGEFFDDTGGDGVREYSLGGLAQLAGSNQLVTAMNDPYPGGAAAQTYWFNNGIQWYSLTDGTHANYVQVDPTYHTDPLLGCDYYNDKSCGFAKSSGVGDVEILVPPAPLEIGNRVWDDVNGNGVQDAGEAGIDDVTVTLNCGGVDFTQTTANGGQYLFTDANVAGGIPRDTDCTISVPTTNNTQTLTVQTSTTDEPLGSNPDSTTGSFTFRTGLAGQNNHTYDIGYRDAPVGGSITIIKDATPDDPQDFAFTATGSGVSNFSLDDDTDGTLSNTQNFTGLSDGAYSFTETTVANWTLTGITCSGATNSTITTNATGVDINLSSGESITCTFYNNNHTCPSGQILNQVVVTANEDESTYANNSDEACLEVTGSPNVDLALTKTASATDAVSGDTVTYTITVTNNGPIDATGIEVMDQLPTGVTYASDTPSQGTYTPGTGIWVVGNLANGANATLAITVSVD
jgi:uncharacterized repeat protein (TIGR01451 family)